MKMNNKLGRLTTALAVVAATVAGTIVIISKVVNKDEESFFEEHIENGGLDAGMPLFVPLQDDEELIFAAKPKTIDVAEEKEPEPVAEPSMPEIVEPEPEPEPEPVVVTPKRGLADLFVGEENINHTVRIGQTIVSDDPEDPIVSGVSEVMEIDAACLVSLTTETMILCMEFSNPVDRNASTLVNVYFVNDGLISLPTAEENENVLAFGRAFLTDVPELKEFLG